MEDEHTTTARGGGALPERTASGGNGSTVNMEYGQRTIKTYPITDEELSQLSTIGYAATFCLSLASGLFGFAISLYKDLSLSKDAPSKAYDFWGQINTLSFWVSVALFIVGIVLIMFRQTRVGSIKSGTKFN